MSFVILILLVITLESIIIQKYLKMNCGVGYDEHRLDVYDKDKEKCRKNIYKSPCFELLKVATNFGVYKSVKEMIRNKKTIFSKRAWSILVWERAWQMEDANQRASNLILKDNQLLMSISKDTRYLSWWRMSDVDYKLTGMCETMCRLICHASLLKSDDFRLKCSPLSNRTCTKCDMYRIEDIVHVITQYIFRMSEMTCTMKYT